VNMLEEEDLRRNYLDQVLHSGERAAWLINQLLSFSRQEPLNPVVLDLNQIVAEMEKLLQRVLGDHIRLTTVAGVPEAYVEADLGQVEQIILNLATNARDAMSRGGALCIETGEVYLDASYVSHHLEIDTGPYVTLTVSDTGSGMDEETRERIFEPFFTTKGVGEGTGLGLATVYAIVRQAGGDIAVESAPGKGTSFTIYLPKTAAPETHPKETEELTPGTVRGSETILLVEDEPGVRALGAAVLQSLGYHVIAAENGHDALVQAVRLDRPVDLLVTDMVMPGLSGLEVAQQLAERYPGLRVLFMSGFSPDTHMGERQARTGSTFLKKPFAPLQLARKVRELLDAGDPARLPTDPRAPINQ
jgi:two-component system, cell cycle sensor histidine kinase and response regulator CckA